MSQTVTSTNLVHSPLSQKQHKIEDFISYEEYFDQNYDIFRDKQRYNTSGNIFIGYNLLSWFRVIVMNWRRIEYKKYWFRVLWYTFLMVIDIPFSILEWLLFGVFFVRQELTSDMVFVLGVPRSGTTHLHNLLCLDEEVIYPNSMECFCCNTFLFHQYFFQFVLAYLLGKKRPMDNVTLDLSYPQEDEFSCHGMVGYSPYHQWFMPASYKDHLAMADPQTTSKYIRDTRNNTQNLFFRKVVFNKRNGKNRQMILKSPQNTANMKYLAERYPNAKFIFIHREPVEMFQSNIKLVQGIGTNSRLNSTTPYHYVNGMVQYNKILINCYLRDKKVVDSSRIIEVSYSDLTAKPVETMRGIYKHFGWSTWDQYVPRLSDYLIKLKSYSKNSHSKIDDVTRRFITDEWSAYYEAFGYDPKAPVE